MRGDGYVYQRGKRWWIAYYAPKDGRSVFQREPARIVDAPGAALRPARNETEARRALKRRRDEIGAHRIGARVFTGPQHERIGLDELLTDLEQHYTVERRASLPQLRSHLKHVRRHFDGWRALAVDASAVRDFIEQRRSQDAAEASIARELEALRRAFTLAAEAGKLAFTPVIPSLSIGHTNARQGFLSRADFVAVLSALEDPDVRDFVEWAWWSGARKGEIAKLRWEYLDRDAWTLTIPAKDAKTRKPRTLALDGPLGDVMRRRLASRVFECPLIFHRAGEPIAEFRKTWATACRKANVAGVLFHDLRRSAIRNMVRAGNDPAVVMKVSGHRTRSVFRPLQHRVRGRSQGGRPAHGRLRGDAARRAEGRQHRRRSPEGRVNTHRTRTIRPCARS